MYCKMYLFAVFDVYTVKPPHRGSKLPITPESFFFFGPEF